MSFGLPLRASFQPLTLSQLQTQFSAKQFGVTFHFNNATFVDVDSPIVPPAINVFNPTALNIDQWMTSALAAKATYAELTAKHITGFCLWPTATTTYNVSNTTWYANNGQIDIVSLFIRKCRQYGLAPSIYFCAKDYTFEAANPGYTQAQYRTYLEAQLTELLSNYGHIQDIKLDATNTAFFPTNGYPWPDTGATVCSFVRSFQYGQQTCNNNAQNNLPPSLVMSNVAIYEMANLPGEFVQAGNTDPAECWDTVYNDGSPASWFWKSTSPAVQTTANMLSNLALANARNSNFNLNFPPDTTGAIESRMVTIMQAIGAR
jgi:alpha-L-fucosidase